MRKVLSITAVAAAPVPPPPVNTTAGVLENWAADEFTATPVTAPAAKVAVAWANPGAGATALPTIWSTCESATAPAHIPVKSLATALTPRSIFE